MAAIVGGQPLNVTSTNCVVDGLKGRKTMASAFGTDRVSLSEHPAKRTSTNRLWQSPWPLFLISRCMGYPPIWASCTSLLRRRNQSITPEDFGRVTSYLHRDELAYAAVLGRIEKWLRVRFNSALETDRAFSMTSWRICMRNSDSGPSRAVPQTRSIRPPKTRESNDLNSRRMLFRKRWYSGRCAGSSAALSRPKKCMSISYAS
jgi:hypothetical protein